MESLFAGLVAFAGSGLLFTRTGATVFEVATLGAVIYLVGVTILKIVKASIYPVYFSKLRHLPGPTDNQFLVGQGLRLLTASGPNELYLEWMRKWPDAPFIRHLSWGNSEVLLLNNLDACREVLQTHAYSFVKPGFFIKLVGEIMGVGPLFSVGDQHRRLRRVMGGPLSRSNIQKLLPIFKDVGEELIEAFNNAIDGETQGLVEVESLYSKTAFKVMGRSLLGKDVGDFRSKSSPLSFEECYKALLNPPAMGKLITFVNPFIPLRWLPIRANLDFIQANIAVRAMVTDLIQERVAEIRRDQKTEEEEPRGGTDLLSKMILANLAEEQRISDSELVDTCVQVVSAGHDTVAGLFTFTTYSLSIYPEMQDRLREEIMAAAIQTPEMDAAIIDSLQYLNNIVNESLRVYSPGLSAPWETGEDVVLAGVAVPKGTTVTTVPAMIQLNPKIWGDDAHVFNPDRWDNLSITAASPFAIEAFINGPRACPGKALGLLEVKSILVQIMRNFRLEAVDGERELEFEHPTLSLKPKGGLTVKLQRL